MSPKRRRSLLLIAAAVPLVVLLWWWCGGSPRQQQQPAQQQRTQQTGAVPESGGTGSPVGVVSATPVLSALPDLEVERREIEANPHEPPRSLIGFGASLAPRLDAALASEGAARSFFTELKDCVLADPTRTSSSARALCFENGRRLARRYPSLQEPLDELSRQADPALKKLIR